MINFFNNFHKKKNGQVSVVILLIVAIALIVYAVTLNLGRVSQTKTTVQIGSNLGAAALGSAMASYGQSLMMQTLGGKRILCDTTGLIGAIFGIIVALVLLVVTLGSAAAASWMIALAAIGAFLSVGSMILQVSVIQPGITNAWNSLKEEILPIADQFMEGALRSSMQYSTNDSKQVPDLYDLDMDGTFGYDSSLSSQDTISRFGLYWGKVFEGTTITNVPEAENFQLALQNFIYPLLPYGPVSDPNKCGAQIGQCATEEECVFNPGLSDFFCEPIWGLIDPLPNSIIPGPTLPRGIGGASIDYSFKKPYDLSWFPQPPCVANLKRTDRPGVELPSVCNPCCLPKETDDPRNPSLKIPIRPACCDCSSQPCTIDVPDGFGGMITKPNPNFCGDPVTCVGDISLECGTVTTCQEHSPYGRITPPPPDPLGTFYGWVYDPFTEDYDDTFLSFRENIGRDDEHQDYFKDSTDPNWAQQYTDQWDLRHYYVEDTTGFYSLFNPMVPKENRTGIFPFLYILTDWGFDLDDITPPLLDNDMRCKWCDPRAGTVCRTELPYSSDIPQLNLWPLDPSPPSPIIPMSDPSYCVSSYIDDISLDAVGSVEVDSLSCVNVYDSNYNGEAFWKRGADRFCSAGDSGTSGGDNAWPYESKCNKYTDGDCCFDRDGVAPYCHCDPDPSVLDDCDEFDHPIKALCECDDPTARTMIPSKKPTPDKFPEDLLDNMVYDITPFIGEANKLLGMTPSRLSRDFLTWFSEWQKWIDPGLPPLLGGNGVAGLSFPSTALPYGKCVPWDEDDDPDTANACQKDPGRLYILHRHIEKIKEKLEILSKQSFQGATDDDPWCIPQRSPKVSIFEQETFDANGNGTEGDMEDIIACLNFNVEGYDYFCNGGVPDISCINSLGTNAGNDKQYYDCAHTCSASNCTILPRTKISPSDYEPKDYRSGNPLDESDMAKMLQCVYTCNNSNCGAMPPTQASSGGGVDYAYAHYLASFDESLHCTSVGGRLKDDLALGGIHFRDLVNQSLMQANITCDISIDGDGNPRGWLSWTEQAAKEAEVQVIKMRLRRNYLTLVSGLLKKHIAMLQEASNKFSEFLTGPVAALLEVRIKYEQNPPPDFPFEAIYGWQDENPPKSRPGGSPYWHIARVEGRMPSRCDNYCRSDGAGADPGWPKVWTYRKDWANRTRCYELINTEGMVKFRVTRYDENPDSAGGGIKFPSGQPIWKFKGAPNGRNPVDPMSLETKCNPIMIEEDTSSGVPTDTFKGAFLMNRRHGKPVDPAECISTCGGSGCPLCGYDCSPCYIGPVNNNFHCWNKSTEILANAGIVSETCAKYYYKGGAKPGLTFSFVNCNDNVGF